MPEMLAQNPNAMSVILMALFIVYVVVKELVMPQVKKQSSDAPAKQPPHFKCEAGRFDQRIVRLETRLDEGIEPRLASVEETIKEVAKTTGAIQVDVAEILGVVKR